MDFFRRKPEIAHQQKLLAMYRALLAEYLRQRKQWERLEVPQVLATGIDRYRAHILEAKGTLRGWKVAVEDHPDDAGPSDDQAREAQHQRTLLGIYRHNLAIFRKQQEQLGDQAPPHIVGALAEAREQISRTKGILRSLGASVEDLPGEDAG